MEVIAPIYEPEREYVTNLTPKQVDIIRTILRKKAFLTNNAQYQIDTIINLMNKGLNITDLIFFLDELREESIELAQRLKISTDAIDNTIDNIDVNIINKAYSYRDLPGDVIRQIALNLPLHDILTNCLLAKKFNQEVCNNERFWSQKTYIDFPHHRVRDNENDIHDRIPMTADTWKDTYRRYHRKLYVYGDLGENHVNEDHPNPTPGIRLNGPVIDNVDFVAGGPTHIALISKGKLYTFGVDKSGYGKLGHGIKYVMAEGGKSERIVSPEYVIGTRNVSYVSCGRQHTAFVSDEKAFTFGKGDVGQLGHGDTKSIRTPREIENYEGFRNEKVTIIGCGLEQTAIVSDGLLYTCGRNNGSLGQGELISWIRRPKLVINLENVSFVSCGENYTAAISSGNLYTTGINRNGALAQKNKDVYYECLWFTLVDYFHNIAPGGVKYISCGPLTMGIIIRNGDLYMVGSNSTGQLGINIIGPKVRYGDVIGTKAKYGNVIKDPFNPIPVKVMKNVDYVACALRHTTIISKGVLCTVGYGIDGQLIHDKLEQLKRTIYDTNTTTIVGLEGLPPVRQVACGDAYTAFIAD